MKRRLVVAAVVGVPLVAAAAVYVPISLWDGAGEQTAAGSATAECQGVDVPAPTGAEIESVTAVSQSAGTFSVPGQPPLGNFPVPDVPAHCRVTVTLTHPGDGDHAKVEVWLPEAGWNGRFQALGGSAYAAGDNGAGLATAIKQGYAAATTNAGVGEALDTSWALNSSGQVDTALLTNFAERSQHELAIIGKQVTAEVYGTAAPYSYWNGCSTGGRQGYVEAQRHPDDFDGILANAPAINWNQFEVATLWPQVVMNEAHTYPTPCTFGAFTRAAVAACDILDGVADGLVSALQRCEYDPHALIGTKIVCDGKESTITAAEADVVRKIWEGPRSSSGEQLWYGLPIGAAFDYLAAVTTDASGTHGAPFPVPAAWVSTFVEKQPTFDTSKLTTRQFEDIFQRARAEYDTVIGSREEDLSAFRDAGGKLLTVHGDADQLIPTPGTVDYRKRVEDKMGGADKVDDFYRLFLAPGTTHCGLSGGKADDLAALVAWVENGKAPDTLTATLTNATGQPLVRELCRYPLISRYTGQGDTAATDSFHCGPA
ncbi:tannase/feruloyl esterase family alpha/beta hydrolase [Nocardia sp. NPDC057272]|uniref:tannase/feruloyl esterase family alpha/beta hydrolase n=1 Tax=Nocardia sp. NPDC057272 TaxID=3346079 RepID=UPI00363FCC73